MFLEWVLKWYLLGKRMIGLIIGLNKNTDCILNKCETLWTMCGNVSMICRRVFDMVFYRFESVEWMNKRGYVPRDKNLYWVVQWRAYGSSWQATKERLPICFRWEKLAVVKAYNSTDSDFNETNVILVWVVWVSHNNNP